MISCDENELFIGPVNWVFELVKKAYGIDIVGDRSFVVKVGNNEGEQIRLSKIFYKKTKRTILYQGCLSFNNYVIIGTNFFGSFVSNRFKSCNSFKI